MGRGLLTTLATGAGALFGGPAGAGLGLSLGASLESMQGQDQANAQNIAQSDKQMDFQERMSSTAHQREMTDLRRSGLNPILTAHNGASSPAGAMAQVKNPLEGAGSSAAEAAALYQQFKKQESEIGLMGSQIDLAKSQSKKADMETQVIKKDLPKAEITNEIYNLLRPIINKVKEGGAAVNQYLHPRGRHGHKQKSIPLRRD